MPFKKGKTPIGAKIFKKGKTGNPNGRPRKIYSILKESGYSKDDVLTAFHEMSWMSIDELKTIFLNKDSPVIIKVIAATFKEAIKKSDYRLVKEIIEQTIGRAKQAVDVTTAGKEISSSVPANISSLTFDQLRELIKESDNSGSKS